MTRKQQRRERIQTRIKLAKASAPLPGIGAQTLRDILTAETREPLRAGTADPRGLFSDAHKQKELF